MSPDRAPPFATFADLEKGIAQHFPRLSKRLRQIAVYALANPGQVALETTTVLAERAGVQPSSLIRFAQVFGFSGYSEMQTVFRLRLTDDFADYEKRDAQPTGRQPAGVAALLQRLVQADVAGLQRLIEDGPTNDLLEQACALMADAHAVYLVASGSSFPVACYLAYALSQMSVRSVLVDGIGGLLLQQAGQSTPRDVLIAITSKADSADVGQIVRESKKRGVRTIVLADSRVNPRTKHTDVMLQAPEMHTIRSLAVPMTLALALVVGLGRQLERKRLSSGVATKAVAGRLRS